MSKTTGGIKIICDNRKAYHNYQIEEKFEAGIALMGTEVKSLRGGKANIGDAYGIFKGKELYLLNAHIPPYEQGNRENHEPLRTRKLLMKRSELDKLWKENETKGLSLIPIKMYFKNGLAKVEIGLGKGKKLHDKRASIKDRDEKRRLDKIVRRTR